MPSFDTPEPISAFTHVGAGSIAFAAGERPDTVVEVRPRDPKRDKDVRAAEQTEVSFAGGVLTVRTKERSFIGPSGLVDVAVDLPEGSRVEMTGSWTQVLGEGRLGEVRVKTSGGDVRLDTTGPLHVAVSHGSITVDRIEGQAEITSSGLSSVRVGAVDGPAVLKNAHGTTTVGTAGGELRLKGAHGDMTVERAESSVTATTAGGALRIGEVVRGTVSLETSYGSIEVGVRAGTAAWLDAASGHGQVRNALAASEAPEETEETVEVRAKTDWGSIEVRRAGA